MKLLLVEDDAATIESIILCLQICEPDYILECTDKGLDALQRIKKESYQGIIIDLGLPDINGSEVINQLRSYSPVPIIVISANHNPDIISHVLKLGANYYFTKPFDYKELLKVLKTLTIISHSLSF